MKQLVLSLVAVVSVAAFAQSQPIKIGEINSYSNIPQFTTPYKQGWQLAVDEVNAAGGLLGRKVEVIARDDAGKPEEALKHAIELTSSEKVDVLAGGFLSNVGLALADYAVKNQAVFKQAAETGDTQVITAGAASCIVEILGVDPTDPTDPFDPGTTTPGE